MYPFRVSSYKSPIRLYKLKDGRYQLIEKGEIGPFLYGIEYLIVERKFAQYLESLCIEGITFKDACLYDPIKKLEINTHVSIILSQHFDLKDIKNLNLNGHKMILLGNEYVFVSPSLKDKLSNAGFPYLEFKEGLSGLVG